MGSIATINWVVGVCIIFQTFLLISDNSIGVSAGRVNRVGGKQKECNVALDADFETKVTNATSKCMQKSMEQPTQKSRPSTNSSIEDFDYDDKCLSHCIYKELNILSSENVPMKDAIDVVKGNFTEIMKQKMDAIWDQCVDDAQRIAKKKQFPSDNCKLATLHSFCYQKKMDDDKVLESC